MEENLNVLLDERKRLELRLEIIAERLKENLETAREEYNINLSSERPAALRQRKVLEEIEQEYTKRAEEETKQIQSSVEAQNRKIILELRAMRDKLLGELNPIEKENASNNKELEEAEKQLEEAEAKYNHEKVALYRQGIFTEPDATEVNSAREKLEGLKQKRIEVEETIKNKQERIDSISQFFGTIMIKDTSVEEIKNILLNEEVKQEVQEELEPQEEPVAEVVEEPKPQETPVVEVVEEPKPQEAPASEVIEEPKPQEAPVAETVEEPAQPKPPVVETVEEPAQPKPPVVETVEEPAQPKTHIVDEAHIEEKAGPLNIAVSRSGIKIGETEIGYKDLLIGDQLNGFEPLWESVVNSKGGKYSEYLQFIEENVGKDRLSKLNSLGDSLILTALVWVSHGKEEFKRNIEKYYELINTPHNKMVASVTYDLKKKPSTMKEKLEAWLAPKDWELKYYESRIKEEAYNAKDYAEIEAGIITKWQFKIKSAIEKSKQKRLDKAKKKETIAERQVSKTDTSREQQQWGKTLSDEQRAKHDAKLEEIRNRAPQTATKYEPPQNLRPVDKDDLEA